MASYVFFVASPACRVCRMLNRDETIETIHDISLKKLAVTP
jgi:hypothetical protein